MQVHHVTFANMAFRRAAQGLRVSAQAFGIETKIYTPWSRAIQKLRRMAPEIMSMQRGAGYWLWKPYLIAKTLDAVPDGDVVIYTDAGVSFASDPRPLIDLAAHHPVVTFELDADPASPSYHALRHWTKRDCFVILDADSERYWNTQSLVASYQLFRAGPQSRAFANEVLAACLDARILTDQANVMGLPNFPSFIDHRHDQSVLTILVEKRGIVRYADPSQFGGRRDVYPTPIFDHHRKRSPPILGNLREKLQIGTKFRRLF